MKKVVLFIACFACLQVWAQDDPFLADFTGMIQYQYGQLKSLAEEMPDEAFDWAPAEGIRKSSGVLLHAAAANYFFSMMLGADMPEGVNPRTLEQEITGRENVMETFNSSYEFLFKTIEGMDPATLNDKVPFPDGNEYTKRAVLLIALSHTAEHKGQSIAYARSNGVTPPWSKPQPKESSEE